MTLNIGEYSPVNIVRVNNILRSQYIIPTNDIDSFLSAQAETQGLVGFEGRVFIFEGITLDIKRKTITETTLTVTYSMLNVTTLLNLKEEQDGSN
jgi:hypothetical protein